MLMRETGQQFGWKLNFGGIALMWHGGCIIRRSVVTHTYVHTYRVAQKNGATLSHCKYSENSMTELRGNW